MEKIKTSENLRDSKITNFLFRFGLITCVIVLFFLTLFSYLYTYSSATNITTNGVLACYGGLKTISKALIFSFLLFLIAFIIKIQKKDLLNWEIVLLICVVVTFIFQVWWVSALNVDSTYYHDSKILLQFAEEFITGDMKSFNTSLDGVTDISSMLLGTQYFTYYPYQSGSLYYFVLIFKIFGLLNGYLAIRLLNCIYTEIIFISLVALWRLYSKDNKNTICLILILFACLPLQYYTTFMYGFQAGIMLATLFITFYTYAIYNKNHLKKSIAYFILAIISFVFMVIIKSSLMIVGIAAFLISFISFFRKKERIISILGIITCILSFLLSSYASKIPVAMLENKLGYSLGNGIPKVAWIAMGLDDNNNVAMDSSMPGWYSGFSQTIKIECMNDEEEMKSLSYEAILSSMKRFSSDLEYTKWFFSQKIATEWFVPDFHASYFSSITYKDDGTGNETGKLFYLDVNDTTDQGKKVNNVWNICEGTYKFMDGYQSFIYIFAFICCVILLKRKMIETHLVVLPCVFIIGFFVYVLWEAQSQYLMPFFVWLIPCAVYGAVSVTSSIQSAIEKHTQHECEN